MTKKGLSRSWWLLTIALVVVGLGWWSLFQTLEGGESIGLSGSIVVLAVGYILWVAGIGLWIDLSKPDDTEKEEQ